LVLIEHVHAYYHHIQLRLIRHTLVHFEIGVFWPVSPLSVRRVIRIFLVDLLLLLFLIIPLIWRGAKIAEDTLLVCVEGASKLKAFMLYWVK
jgi:TRAP-type C4-dicarboxylate transport system permease small subunit